MYNGYMSDEAELNASYDAILERQEHYAIELVNNEQFAQFASYSPNLDEF